MNILLTGGSSSLIDSMILKLRKEGHRVFILTGDKYKHNKYEKVFEKYEFPYDSENLNEILESVNPDVTILMGAFDTNYYWNGEEVFRFRTEGRVSLPGRRNVQEFLGKPGNGSDSLKAGSFLWDS